MSFIESKTSESLREYIYGWRQIFAALISKGIDKF